MSMKDSTAEGIKNELGESTSGVEVVGSLGVAEKLLKTQGDLQPYKSWMGISTSYETYPDATVLEFARWASENTAGFTLVVSNYVQTYNWAAEHIDPDEDNPDSIGLSFLLTGGGSLDWEVFNKGKHKKEQDRLARKRVATFQELFAANGINGKVVLWEDLLRNILENSKETDTDGWIFYNEQWQQLWEAVTAISYMRDDVTGVHKHLVPHLIDRFTAKGQDEGFVNSVLQEYTVEEIFLTTLMAETRWANIKIGPEWERHYDAITHKYLLGQYFGRKEPSKAPFGAVYLRHSGDNQLQENVD